MTTKPMLSPRFAISLVLIVLGVVSAVLSAVGTGRMGVGALFFDGDEASVLIAQADKSLEPVNKELCQNAEMVQSLMSSQILEAGTLCGALTTFRNDKTPEAAVQVLERFNRDLRRLSTILTDKGVDAGGKTGIILLEADCATRPQLERLHSLTAGAAFSQFLVGVITFIVGLVFLKKRGHNEGEPKTPSDQPAD